MKNFICILFTCFITNVSVSQNENGSISDKKELKNEVDIIIDDLFEEEEESDKKETSKKEEDKLIEAFFRETKELDALVSEFSDFQFLYFSMDYNSDTYFSGRDIGIDQYNLRPQVSYMNSKGFFASISGIYYSGFDPKWDFTSISTGYGKSFGKKKLLRFTASYSRYIYSKGVDNPFTNAISIGSGIRNKKRTLGTRLSVTRSFGKEEKALQISSGTYARFKLIKKEKLSLYFRPRLNFLIGNQTFYDETETEFIDGEEFLKEQEVFGLMNIQFNLPVLLTVDNFDFELGYNFNLPQEPSGVSDFENTSFFNFSIAYLLEL